MKVDFVNSAVKDLRKLETKLTREIRLAAIRAGWDKNLVKNLNVKVKADDIVVTYPDSDAEAIENLEYGTKLTSPRPVFRAFMNKRTQQISESVEDMVMRQLTEQADR